MNSEQITGSFLILPRKDRAKLLKNLRIAHKKEILNCIQETIDRVKSIFKLKKTGYSNSYKLNYETENFILIFNELSITIRHETKHQIRKLSEKNTEKRILIGKSNDEILRARIERQLKNFITKSVIES